MMPQKKNPDVLELVRGRTGQVLGHMMDLLVTLKGLPMTYDRDLQEDKRGLWASVGTVEAVLAVLTPMLARTDVDADAARAGLEKGFALATDVAEYLVLRGVPFRDAHWKVGRLVRRCIERGSRLEDLTLEAWKEQIPEVEADVLELLSPEASVRRRNTYGGTGFEQVALRIAEGKERLAERRTALERRKKRLEGSWL